MMDLDTVMQGAKTLEEIGTIVAAAGKGAKGIRDGSEDFRAAFEKSHEETEKIAGELRDSIAQLEADDTPTTVFPATVKTGDQQADAKIEEIQAAFEQRMQDQRNLLLERLRDSLHLIQNLNEISANNLQIIGRVNDSCASILGIVTRQNEILKSHNAALETISNALRSL